MFFSASATSSRLAVLSILKSTSPPVEFDDNDEGGDLTLFFLVEFLGLTGESIFFPPIVISSC